MVTIDLDSDVPLVDQIVRAIRVAIACGAVRPGAELPPVRQLANDLAINLNTVARAYRVLHSRGLVHSARGRSTRVTSALEKPSEAEPIAAERISDAIRNALADAKLAGLGRYDAQGIIDEQLESFWGAPAGKEVEAKNAQP